jgi:histidine triad (HIT) family protein
MATVFSRVINGELPGRIVYTDELCAAFLTIAPLRTGHTLVVPRVEIESWLDLPADLLAHLSAVAQRVGVAVRQATGVSRVGLIIAGFEVDHVHLHVVPAESLTDLDFTRVDTSPDPVEQDAVAQLIRDALAA